VAPGEIIGRERELAALAAFADHLEQGVAELVAEGRTNGEVAAALFVTDRTVESHLSRIYGKLGVRSRAELAARYAQR
jgi:DNA-binding NarL/FixJ family response regulator